MEVNFKLYSPPQSVNSAFYRNRQRTQKTRLWSKSIHDQLSSPKLKKEIERFTRAFSPLKHCIRLTIEFYIPREKFFTKKGYISRKSTDLDNCLKLLIDTVFDPRFFKRELFNFNIDDTFIQTIIASKHAADKHSIKIKVERMDLHQPLLL